MKPRINVYLEDHVAAQLALICKRPGSNKSRIVNDALDRFFNPEKDTDTSKALIRRLDSMSRSMERMDRNQSIEVETLALFIRYFLTITPPLPESDQASAHALGRERFEVFVSQVGRRLAQDKNLLSEVLETIADTRPDLFAIDPDQVPKPRQTKTSPSDADVDDVVDGGANDSTNGSADNSVNDSTDCNVIDTDLPPLRPVIVEDDGEADSYELEDSGSDYSEFEEEHLDDIVEDDDPDGFGEEADHVRFDHAR